MKKRKLNSKNPKYTKDIEGPKIKERRLEQEINGCKIYSVFLETNL